MTIKSAINKFISQLYKKEMVTIMTKWLISSKVLQLHNFSQICSSSTFYPTALKGCRGIVFTHGVRIGGQGTGKSLSRLYIRNRKV